jgi:hypothetical protein
MRVHGDTALARTSASAGDGSVLAHVSWVLVQSRSGIPDRDRCAIRVARCADPAAAHQQQPARVKKKKNITPEMLDTDARLRNIVHQRYQVHISKFAVYEIRDAISIKHV